MQTWPKIDPGAMVHQITILQQTQGTDISGAVTVWTPFVSTWASIDPVRGTDVLKAGQDTTNLYLRVCIRWQTGIQPNMRVQRVDGVTTYVIQAIENPGERNVVLVLFCLALGLNQ
jgi:SPP1 family predicted phage head-tail adaptor